jgi:pterin-4a-carbinolamine dehydratase
MSELWKARAKPDSLEAKFVFSGYQSLRDFLDDVAQEAEKRAVHPNVSFGRDYASLVIYPLAEALGEQEKALAEAIDKAYWRRVA